jgi:uncharacterized protein (UPF0332 family)
MRIEELIKEGYLSRVKKDEKLVKKELDEAEYDFEKAQISFGQKDYKWSSVKAYYSMFHAARGVLFSLGLKDRRHFAVGMVLEELTKNGKLELKFVDEFRAAMSAREDADYRHVYSNETAEYIVDSADDFLKRMKKLIKNL